MMAKTNVSIFFRSRNRIIHAVCQIRHNLSIKRSKEFFKEFFLDLPTLIRGFEFRPRNLGRRVSGWLPNFRSKQTKGSFCSRKGEEETLSENIPPKIFSAAEKLTTLLLETRHDFPREKKRILEISGLCEWFTGEGIFSRERYRENNGPINVPNVRNLLLYSVSRGSVQPDDHLPAGGGRKRETK